MTADPPRCANCRFFVPAMPSLYDAYCRRRAPQPAPPGQYQARAGTYPDGWCGEHEQGPPYATPGEQCWRTAENEYQAKLRADRKGKPDAD